MAQGSNPVRFVGATEASNLLAGGRSIEADFSEMGETQPIEERPTGSQDVIDQFALNKVKAYVEDPLNTNFRSDTYKEDEQSIMDKVKSKLKASGIYEKAAKGDKTVGDINEAIQDSIKERLYEKTGKGWIRRGIGTIVGGVTEAAGTFVTAPMKEAIAEGEKIKEFPSLLPTSMEELGQRMFTPATSPVEFVTRPLGLDKLKGVPYAMLGEEKQKALQEKTQGLEELAKGTGTTLMGPGLQFADRDPVTGQTNWNVSAIYNLTNVGNAVSRELPWLALAAATRGGAAEGRMAAAMPRLGRAVPGLEGLVMEELVPGAERLTSRLASGEGAGWMRRQAGRVGTKLVEEAATQGGVIRTGLIYGPRVYSGEVSDMADKYMKAHPGATYGEALANVNDAAIMSTVLQAPIEQVFDSILAGKGEAVQEAMRGGKTLLGKIGVGAKEAIKGGVGGGISEAPSEMLEQVISEVGKYMAVPEAIDARADELMKADPKLSKDEASRQAKSEALSESIGAILESGIGGLQVGGMMGGAMGGARGATARYTTQHAAQDLGVSEPNVRAAIQHEAMAEVAAKPLGEQIKTKEQLAGMIDMFMNEHGRAMTPDGIGSLISKGSLESIGRMKESERIKQAEDFKETMKKAGVTFADMDNGSWRKKVVDTFSEEKAAALDPIVNEGVNKTQAILVDMVKNPVRRIVKDNPEMLAILQDTSDQGLLAQRKSRANGGVITTVIPKAEHGHEAVTQRLVAPVLVGEEQDATPALEMYRRVRGIADESSHEQTVKAIDSFYQTKTSALKDTDLTPYYAARATVIDRYINGSNLTPEQKNAFLDQKDPMGAKGITYRQSIEAVRKALIKGNEIEAKYEQRKTEVGENVARVERDSNPAYQAVSRFIPIVNDMIKSIPASVSASRKALMGAYAADVEQAHGAGRFANAERATSMNTELLLKRAGLSDAESQNVMSTYGQGTTSIGSLDELLQHVQAVTGSRSKADLVHDMFEQVYRAKSMAPGAETSVSEEDRGVRIDTAEVLSRFGIDDDLKGLTMPQVETIAAMADELHRGSDTTDITKTIARYRENNRRAGEQLEQERRLTKGEEPVSKLPVEDQIAKSVSDAIPVMVKPSERPGKRKVMFKTQLEFRGDLGSSEVAISSDALEKTLLHGVDPTSVEGARILQDAASVLSKSETVARMAVARVLALEGDSASMSVSSVQKVAEGLVREFKEMAAGNRGVLANQLGSYFKTAGIPSAKAVTDVVKSEMDLLVKQGHLATEAGKKIGKNVGNVYKPLGATSSWAGAIIQSARRQALATTGGARALVKAESHPIFTKLQSGIDHLTEILAENRYHGDIDAAMAAVESLKSIPDQVKSWKLEMSNGETQIFFPVNSPIKSIANVGIPVGYLLNSSALDGHQKALVALAYVVSPFVSMRHNGGAYGNALDTLRGGYLSTGLSNKILGELMTEMTGKDYTLEGKTEDLLINTHKRLANTFKGIAPNDIVLRFPGAIPVELQNVIREIMVSNATPVEETQAYLKGMAEVYNIPDPIIQSLNKIIEPLVRHITNTKRVKYAGTGGAASEAMINFASAINEKRSDPNIVKEAERHAQVVSGSTRPTQAQINESKDVLAILSTIASYLSHTPITARTEEAGFSPEKGLAELINTIVSEKTKGTLGDLLSKKAMSKAISEARDSFKSDADKLMSWAGKIIESGKLPTAKQWAEVKSVKTTLYDELGSKMLKWGSIASGDVAVAIEARIKKFNDEGATAATADVIQAVQALNWAAENDKTVGKTASRETIKELDKAKEGAIKSLARIIHDASVVMDENESKESIGNSILGDMIERKRYALSFDPIGKEDVGVFPNDSTTVARLLLDAIEVHTASEVVNAMRDTRAILMENLRNNTSGETTESAITLGEDESARAERLDERIARIKNLGKKLQKVSAEISWSTDRLGAKVNELSSGSALNLSDGSIIAVSRLMDEVKDAARSFRSVVTRTGVMGVTLTNANSTNYREMVMGSQSVLSVASNLSDKLTQLIRNVDRLASVESVEGPTATSDMVVDGLKGLQSMLKGVDEWTKPDMAASISMANEAGQGVEAIRAAFEQENRNLADRLESGLGPKLQDARMNPTASSAMDTVEDPILQSGALRSSRNEYIKAERLYAMARAIAGDLSQEEGQRLGMTFMEAAKELADASRSTEQLKKLNDRLSRLDAMQSKLATAMASGNPEIANQTRSINQEIESVKSQIEEAKRSNLALPISEREQGNQRLATLRDRVAKLQEAKDAIGQGKKVTNLRTGVTETLQSLTNQIVKLKNEAESLRRKLYDGRPEFTTAQIRSIMEWATDNRKQAYENMANSLIPVAEVVASQMATGRPLTEADVIPKRIMDEMVYLSNSAVELLQKNQEGMSFTIEGFSSLDALLGSIDTKAQAELNTKLENSNGMTLAQKERSRAGITACFTSPALLLAAFADPSIVGDPATLKAGALAGLLSLGIHKATVLIGERMGMKGASFPQIVSRLTHAGLRSIGDVAMKIRKAVPEMAMNVAKYLAKFYDAILNRGENYLVPTKDGRLVDRTRANQTGAIGELWADMVNADGTTSEAGKKAIADRVNRYFANPVEYYKHYASLPETLDGWFVTADQALGNLILRGAGLDSWVHFREWLGDPKVNNVMTPLMQQVYDRAVKDRALIVVGPNGVGKSRGAAALKARVGDDYDFALETASWDNVSKQNILSLVEGIRKKGFDVDVAIITNDPAKVIPGVGQRNVDNNLIAASDSMANSWNGAADLFASLKEKGLVSQVMSMDFSSGTPALRIGNEAGHHVVSWVKSLPSKDELKSMIQKSYAYAMPSAKTPYTRRAVQAQLAGHSEAVVMAKDDLAVTVKSAVSPAIINSVIENGPIADPVNPSMVNAMSQAAGAPVSREIAASVNEALDDMFTGTFKGERGTTTGTFMAGVAGVGALGLGAGLFYAHPTLAMTIAAGGAVPVMSIAYNSMKNKIIEARQSRLAATKGAAKEIKLTSWWDREFVQKGALLARHPLLADLFNCSNAMDHGRRAVEGEYDPQKMALSSYQQKNKAGYKNLRDAMTFTAYMGEAEKLYEASPIAKPFKAQPLSDEELRSEWKLDDEGIALYRGQFAAVQKMTSMTLRAKEMEAHRAMLENSESIQRAETNNDLGEIETLVQDNEDIQSSLDHFRQVIGSNQVYLPFERQGAQVISVTVDDPALANLEEDQQLRDLYGLKPVTAAGRYRVGSVFTNGAIENLAEEQAKAIERVRRHMALREYAAARVKWEQDGSIGPAPTSDEFTQAVAAIKMDVETHQLLSDVARKQMRASAFNSSWDTMSSILRDSGIMSEELISRVKRRAKYHELGRGIDQATMARMGTPGFEDDPIGMLEANGYKSGLRIAMSENADSLNRAMDRVKEALTVKLEKGKPALSASDAEFAMSYVHTALAPDPSWARLKKYASAVRLGVFMGTLMGKLSQIPQNLSQGQIVSKAWFQSAYRNTKETATAYAMGSRLSAGMFGETANPFVNYSTLDDKTLLGVIDRYLNTPEASSLLKPAKDSDLTLDDKKSLFRETMLTAIRKGSFLNLEAAISMGEETGQAKLLSAESRSKVQRGLRKAGEIGTYGTFKSENYNRMRDFTTALFLSLSDHAGHGIIDSTQMDGHMTYGRSEFSNFMSSLKSRTEANLENAGMTQAEGNAIIRNEAVNKLMQMGDMSVAICNFTSNDANIEGSVIMNNPLARTMMMYTMFPNRVWQAWKTSAIISQQLNPDYKTNASHWMPVLRSAMKSVMLGGVGSIPLGLIGLEGLMNALSFLWNQYLLNFGDGIPVNFSKTYKDAYAKSLSWAAGIVGFKGEKVDKYARRLAEGGVTDVLPFTMGGQFNLGQGMVKIDPYAKSSDGLKDMMLKLFVPVNYVYGIGEKTLSGRFTEAIVGGMPRPAQAMAYSLREAMGGEAMHLSPGRKLGEKEAEAERMTYAERAGWAAGLRPERELEYSEYRQEINDYMGQRRMLTDKEKAETDEMKAAMMKNAIYQMDLGAYGKGLRQRAPKTPQYFTPKRPSREMQTFQQFQESEE